MFAQRTTQQALRRLAASNPSMVTRMVTKNFAAPLAVASMKQIRPVTTQNMTPEDSQAILVAQRRLRPVSPHLGIYKPQITWYASMFHRITGVILSGTLYIFGSAYLVAPLFGWHLESATIAAAFATWPVAAKVATKFFFAMPFTFHSFNAFRHFAWDTGRQFSKETVIRTGFTVVGLSTASALALATMF